MQIWFAFCSWFVGFFFKIASGRFASSISLPETYFTILWRMFSTYLLLGANRLNCFALNMYLLILLYFPLAILLLLRVDDYEKSLSENCASVLKWWDWIQWPVLTLSSVGAIEALCRTQWLGKKISLGSLRGGISLMNSTFFSFLCSDSGLLSADFS